MNQTTTDQRGTLGISARKPGLRTGRREVVEVLVRIQAPDPDPALGSTRPPLNLALVLDRSGSMDGRPLEEAKRCAIEVVDGLLPTDRVAIVAYDDQPTVLVANRGVGERGDIRRALSLLRCGGTTNLFAGWQEGVQQLQPFRGTDALSRVLLLSDGQANRGLVESAAIAEHAAAAAAGGIATSTYGLGHSFNELLMTAMARAGHGSAWYGETAADLRQPFRDELALLQSTWATDVTLAVLPADGAKATLRNDYPCSGARSAASQHPSTSAPQHVSTSARPHANTSSRSSDPASSTWCLPDIALGSEAWALLEVSVPVPAAGPVPLLAATVAFHDRSTGRSQLLVESLALPVMSDDAWAGLPEDELIARRSAEIRAAELQDEARAAVARGDWGDVDALLRDAKVLAAGSPWVKEVVGVLAGLASQRDDALFCKEATYAAMKMKSRLAAKHEVADPSLESSEAEWLRRKGRQGRSRA
jgi:Ca-activated chloride channel family protein